jgi:hypothetical protein
MTTKNTYTEVTAVEQRSSGAMNTTSITSTTEGDFTWNTNHITTMGTDTTTVAEAHEAAAGDDGAANGAAGAADAEWAAATSAEPSSRRCKLDQPTAMPLCAGWKR